MEYGLFYGILTDFKLNDCTNGFIFKYKHAAIHFTRH